jgi:hypothetical protein
MPRRTRMFLGLFALSAMFIGLGAGACINLEDDLEGEPCTEAKDCWHTQECTQTIEEEALALPGSCQKEGTGCVQGAQLGCTCNPVDPSIACGSPALPPSLYAIYPKMVCDETLLVCVVAPPEETPP